MNYYSSTCKICEEYDCRKRHFDSFWIGDKVSYRTLHVRVKKLYPKPDRCILCEKKTNLHLCNIGRVVNLETYNDRLENWFYSCSSCHKLYDLGRISKDEVLKKREDE